MLVLLLSDVVLFVSNLATLMLCARAILSWFAQNPYSPQYKYYMLVVKLTDPVVKPCRKILQNFNTGTIDFSVLLAMLAIQFISTVIIRILTYSLIY